MKKRYFRIAGVVAGILASFAILLCFAACKQPDSNVPGSGAVYSITFNSGDGKFSDNSTSKKVTSSTKRAVLPADFPSPAPTLSGMLFTNYYTAQNGGSAVTAGSTQLQPEANNFTVYARYFNVAQAIQAYIDEIDAWFTTMDPIEADLALPSQSPSGITVAWESSNTEYILDDGTLRRRPAYEEGDKDITLTATFSYSGTAPITEHYTVTVLALPEGQVDATLSLRYDFTPGSGADVADKTGNNHGTLYGGAALGTLPGSAGNIGYMATGSGNGYLDMGSNAGSLITGPEGFTIASYVFVEEAAALSGNGWFLWCMANTTSAGQNDGVYMFYRTVAMRQAFSLGGYNSSNETNVTVGGNIPKGEWKHVLYRQQGYSGEVFIDGYSVASGDINIMPSDLTNLQYNWLGRPCFSGDNYMRNTRYSDFRIYTGAVSDSQIDGLNISSTLTSLATAQDQVDVNAAIVSVTAFLGDLTAVTKSINLLTNINGVDIVWVSDNPSVMDNTGAVTLQQNTVSFTLSATFTKGNASGSAEFAVTVLPGTLANVQGKIKQAEVALGDLSTVTEDVILPASDGTVTVAWSSSNPSVFSNSGQVNRQSSNTTLTLTGTFTLINDTNISRTKDWEVRVMRNGADISEFLVLDLQFENNVLVNKAASGTFYEPQLMRGAAIQSQGTYDVINLGNNGYIDLGPKAGSLLRKTEWSIEFYLYTPSIGGSMFSFANQNNISDTNDSPWTGAVSFVVPMLSFLAYTNGRVGHAISAQTQTDTFINTGRSNGLNTGPQTGRWTHIMICRQDNYLAIFRYCNHAQNDRDYDFSRLSEWETFKGADNETWPLQYGYMGRSVFDGISSVASAEDVAQVSGTKFYGVKFYTRSLVTVTGAAGDDNSIIWQEGRDTRRPVADAMNDAFGYDRVP